jgi:hypothetical protein
VPENKCFSFHSATHIPRPARQTRAVPRQRRKMLFISHAHPARQSRFRLGTSWPKMLCIFFFVLLREKSCVRCVPFASLGLFPDARATMTSAIGADH